MSSLDSAYDFRIKAQPIAFFETPIAYCKLSGGDSFLEDIEQVVRQQRETDPGVKRSNLGGW
ncbi:MAG: hypothetical protein KJN90_02430, partial [Gammaproteobacteria bacterium]|nr:hypothetical protein [Gammaproteobacteria bacterium]